MFKVLKCQAIFLSHGSFLWVRRGENKAVLYHSATQPHGLGIGSDL